jgi:hypothetical protein
VWSQGRIRSVRNRRDGRRHVNHADLRLHNRSGGVPPGQVKNGVPPGHRYVARRVVPVTGTRNVVMVKEGKGHGRGEGKDKDKGDKGKGGKGKGGKGHDEDHGGGKGKQ